MCTAPSPLLKGQFWLQPTVVFLRVGRNMLLYSLFFTELCRAKGSYHHEGASLTSSSSRFPTHSIEEFHLGEQ